MAAMLAACAVLRVNTAIALMQMHSQHARAEVGC